jgi:glycerate 2-kinase
VDCTLPPMRVLVAPDKFRGTLSAAEAAEAVADGWRRSVPHAEVDRAPMADGGEGTLDALLAGLGGETFVESVTGPLGEPVRASHAVVRSPDGPLGVVEMARASGLALVRESRRDPRWTTTRGTGELVLAAARRGVRRIMVCIGGSATNDAGAGMAQALGVRLLDAEGREVGPGGASLLRLARIDATGLDPAVARAEFVVATDVDNPLTGPFGASVVYGPQKGATPEDVALLDRALAHYAALLHRDLGIDVRDVPGTGAAGGIGASLIAFLGARLRPGVDIVMEAVGLEARLAGSDVVVTGEGKFDGQSLRGKTVAGVLRAARTAGVPAVVLCGVREVDAPGATVASLAERFGLEAAHRRAGPLLRDLAAEVAADLDRHRRG